MYRYVAFGDKKDFAEIRMFFFISPSIILGFKEIDCFTLLNYKIGSDKNGLIFEVV